MQPKAAKKIGGMTPKKMTGGDYGEPEKITLGSDYTITKQIDEQNGKMMICVESEMPGAVKKEEEGSAVPPSLEQQAAEIGPEFFENEAIPEGDNLTQEVVDAAKVKKQQQQGGKKKRKSSKKRKSMKKKGGMKRKSMKVKA